MVKEQIEELEKARGKLVEARHDHARSIASNSGAMPDALIARFVDIQDAIEAIDRAIKDERTSKPKARR